MKAAFENVGSDSWCTDRETARMLGHFGTDPCSNPRSHISADRNLMLEHGDDGLTSEWVGSVFWNGPYSNPLPWCVRLAAHHGPWVALTKSDPTTKWFAVLKSACAGDAPFRHRLKFERPDKPPMTANFPSHLFWCRCHPSAELASHLWLPNYARAA